jgi:hypothetical protein
MPLSGGEQSFWAKDGSLLWRTPSSAPVIEKEKAKNLKTHESQNGRRNCKQIETGGGGHSDSGGDPDAGRRCESMYGMLVNHDRPGADESDSAHNLRGDATWVAHATKPML